MSARRLLTSLFSLALAAATPAFGQDCDQTFDSTYDLIQTAIFDNKGCTNLNCHGAVAAGGLDLRAGVSYDHLIERAATTIPDGTITGLKRVVPGQKDQSLLFLNLAAGTLPEQWRAPLRAMPIGLQPLSLNELEAVRQWIEQGAPRQGTVGTTGELLDACLPAAKPIPIEPLPAPAAEEGVQVRMPKWILPANSEDEVCFVSYYDVSASIPERFLSEDGQTFSFKLNQVRQDPLSHHLIVDYYFGNAPLNSDTWGEFLCRGGEKEGQACEPTDLAFCGEGICGSEATRSLACIGFGPPDLRRNSFGFSGTQEASQQISYPANVYNQLPVRGVVVWNSHAFNLTEEDGKLEAWLNFEFAEPEERGFNAFNIFNDDEIFKMDVAPFEAKVVCNHHVFPPDARLFELNSHTHQRGKRFNVFAGRFACDGGANAGDPCSPVEETSVPVPDNCPDAACVRMIPPEVGDCDGDGLVGINDLTTAINILLDRAPRRRCWTADPDNDGQVSVADLVRAVREALKPVTVDPSEPALLYTNLVYNDPTVVRFDPPRAYPGRNASAAARTLTYCSLYDNGYSDPGEVKMRATSPPTPIGVLPGIAGGPCITPKGCTEGRVGEACSGTTEAARNASCDTSTGAGDGFCDACQLLGGVTTEDEMFILLGYYFVEP